MKTKYHFNLEWFDVELDNGVFISKEEKAFGSVRGYKQSNTPEYDGVAQIVKRSNGLHEPLAWMVRGEGTPLDLSIQGAAFLIQQGLRLAWTFEVEKFKQYKRLLRSIGELKILKTFKKEYNGIVIEFHYGKIIPHGKQDKGNNC